MSGPVGLDPAPLLAAVPGSQREQAEACGVTTRTIIRWRQGHTGVDRRIADEVATRLAAATPPTCGATTGGPRHDRARGR